MTTSFGLSEHYLAIFQKL